MKIFTDEFEKLLANALGALLVFGPIILLIWFAFWLEVNLP